MDEAKLKRAAILRFSLGILGWGVIFFLTAGTFRWWEAWVFMAILFIPLTFALVYLFRYDPELLRRRMKAREERPRQKTVQNVAVLVQILVFILPGLDRRFEWSSVPLHVIIMADMAVLAGYLIFFRTLRENRYAARIIQVEKGQQVITTGPYTRVRHPMYTGVSLMFICAPLALGSWWAVLPALTTPIFLHFRIRDEEEALLKELPGYREYTEKTRYRLIPGVW